MNDTGVVQHIQRADVLASEYTEKLDVLVKEIVPVTLANDEYAARCAALMIALNRELARCAASFGETHGIMPDQMVELVGNQFVKNLNRCMEAINEGAGGRVH